MNRLMIAALIIVLTALTPLPAHAVPFEEALAQSAPQNKYIFYLHGAIMEEQGKNAVSQRYGIYLYDSIIKHFEDRGFTVIEEVRPKTNPNRYAARITSQIRTLMAAGVPAGNITVVGFSKGGYMALLTASSLANPSARYVILAGCGKGRKSYAYDQFLKRKRGARLRGRILSLYTGSDLEAGSCVQAFAQSKTRDLVFSEKRIKSTKGHGLFYQPRPEWISPVARFAKGE